MFNFLSGFSFEPYYEGDTEMLPFIFSFIAVYFVFFVVIWVISFAVSILDAYGTYKLASACDRPYKWMAWVGLIIPILSMYILVDIPGDKPFSYFNLFKLKNRRNVFWIILGTYAVLTVFMSVAMILSIVPVLGIIFLILMYIVMFAANVILITINYFIIKDILDTFKPGDSSNTGIAILCCLVPIAWLVFKLIIMKNEPVMYNGEPCEEPEPAQQSEQINP